MLVRSKALLRAAACTRLAEAEIDPDRRALLQYVAHLWSTLAEEIGQLRPYELDAHYKELLAVEALLTDEILTGTMH
jgi:hypothetical protein